MKTNGRRISGYAVLGVQIVAITAVLWVDAPQRWPLIAVIAICAVICGALILADSRRDSMRQQADQSRLVEWMRDIDLDAASPASPPTVAGTRDTEIAEAAHGLQQRVHDYRRKLLARHQRMQRMIRNVTDVVYQLDSEDRLRWVSNNVTELLGFSPAELDGLPLARLLVDPDSDLDDLLLKERIERRPTRVYRKDGSHAWMLVSARRLDNAEGQRIGSEGIWRDGTRLIELQQQLDDEKERAQVTLSAIGDGVFTTDEKGLISYANPRAQRILSLARGDIENRRFDEVCPLRNPEKNSRVTGLVEACLSGGTPNDVAQTLIIDNNDAAPGQPKQWVTVNVSPIRDNREHVSGAVIVLHDVTRLHRISRELTYQANHDTLTGLLNRRAFEQRLHTALESARDRGLQHALCYIDLDQFKLVNDSCGHHAGDAMLRQLASRLTAEMRPEDTLARLGGDEFGLIVEDTDLEHASVIAERLRNRIEGFRFHWQSRVFRLGASIGLVGIAPDSVSSEELLRRADTACYLAKEQGRNHIQIYRYDSDEARMRDYEIERMQQISEALDNAGFELHAQPIRSLADTSDAPRFGLELLLRLKGADARATPQNLLLTAERYSVAPRIDRWVIDHALTLISQHHVESSAIEYYSVNISGQSITDEQFVGFVRERVAQSGVDPRRLVFEITETAAVTNLQRAGELIRSLRAIGCRFALDDFGSGLSSFSYLKHLPSDFVKIDGKLVRRMIEDPVEHSIIEAISRVSDALGLQTVAEHVETSAQFDALRQIGIDYVQGYYIGRPQSFRLAVENCHPAH